VQGNIPDGLKLVDKRSNRSWKDEGEAIEALQFLGLNKNDIMTVPKLKSPAQVEKIFKNKKEAAPLVSPLVQTKSSGTVLVKEDDKRPAITTLKAEDVFTEVS